MKYIIYWRHKITDKSGRGNTPIEKTEAESWLSYLNKSFPKIRHWIEEVKEIEATK